MSAIDHATTAALLLSTVALGTQALSMRQKAAHQRSRLAKRWTTKPQGTGASLPWHADVHKWLGQTRRALADVPHIGLVLCAAIVCVTATFLAATHLVDTAAGLGVAIMAFTAALWPVSARVAAKTAHRKKLKTALPSIFERLAVSLAAGQSLLGAASRLAEDCDGPAAAVMTALTTGIASGLTPTQVTTQLAETFTPEVAEQFSGVLYGASQGADTVKIARSAAEELRKGEYRERLSQLEKNAQKIWMPITVAALVPGVIIIFVPFITVLKSVAGA